MEFLYFFRRYYRDRRLRSAAVNISGSTKERQDIKEWEIGKKRSISEAVLKGIALFAIYIYRGEEIPYIAKWSVSMRERERGSEKGKNKKIYTFTTSVWMKFELRMMFEADAESESPWNKPGDVHSTLGQMNDWPFLSCISGNEKSMLCTQPTTFSYFVRRNLFLPVSSDVSSFIDLLHT